MAEDEAHAAEAEDESDAAAVENESEAVAAEDGARDDEDGSNQHGGDEGVDAVEQTERVDEDDEPRDRPGPPRTPHERFP